MLFLLPPLRPSNVDALGLVSPAASKISSPRQLPEFVDPYSRKSPNEGRAFGTRDSDITLHKNSPPTQAAMSILSFRSYLDTGLPDILNSMG